MQVRTDTTATLRFTDRALSILSVVRGVLPGVLLCAAIAAVATVVGEMVPVVGAAIPAVAIGILVALFRPIPRQASPGIRFTSKTVLQLAVVLLGSQLKLSA